MPLTQAAMYLPISERLLRPVLDSDVTFEDAVAQLTVPQIAALLVLQYLPKLTQHGTLSLDRILIEAIKTGTAQVKRDGAAALAADAARLLSRSRIREGYDLLADFEVALLDDDELTERSYLTADGEWDSAYRERLNMRMIESSQRIRPSSRGSHVLTTEQSRIFREVKAQTDDHMHVQGYGGTGKSYLIKSLLSMLEPTGARILVLAERQRQLAAFLRGLDHLAGVYPKRFDSLISEMIPPNLTDPVNRHMKRTDYRLGPISDDDVVRHLGIHSSGGLSPSRIVKVVRSTVAAFCFSDDTTITSQHIPEWSLPSLDEVTRTVVLHHATELWRAILRPPSRDFRPPVRGFHRVKWAALNGWKIPARYTHVLIDECHDVSKPMLQILDISSQAVISLGDEYQNLHGRAERRSSVVRQRAVINSIRSGRLVENVVNPIIAAHPGRTKLPFRGNPLNRTDIQYYDKPQVPPQPAVILVNDTWGLFEWAQRLASNRVDFELLSSRANLNMFVSDCIELHQHGTRPRHGELFRFDTWESVSKHYCDNLGFQRIDRMLNKGYSLKDWLKTTAQFGKGEARGYAVGLIEDVRNREFEGVMLVPELVGQAFRERLGFGAAGSAIYVAVTRAQRRLVLPESLRNWIEEISSSLNVSGGVT